MNEELKTQIIIGDEAEKFALTQLGKEMCRLANSDADAAVLAFSEVDPADTRKVQGIQQDLRVAMRFEMYLAELVQRGREAMSAYQQQQEDQ